MAETLIKHALGTSALRRIADAGKAADTRFDRAAFLKASREGLGDLSIMQRVRHIADGLHAALPKDTAIALRIVRAMGPHVEPGFQGMVLAEFVARHATDDLRGAARALADLTQYGSAEFAVRPFLARTPGPMLAIMEKWSKHKNEHVRRLASEGSRPRLPWATRVPALSADSTLAHVILENLKDDPSAYVRRSVANHLNDITKDRPEWVTGLLSTWPLGDKNTASIARHALRTLIKKGDKRALTLMGAGARPQLEVLSFTVTPKKVRLGATVTLVAELRSKSTQEQRLVLDYRIHYVRQGDVRSQKVFKLKLFSLAGKKMITLSRKQTIKDFTTRRHHAGRHKVELLANGVAIANAAFDLLL